MKARNLLAIMFLSGLAPCLPAQILMHHWDFSVYDDDAALTQTPDTVNGNVFSAILPGMNVQDGLLRVRYESSTLGSTFATINREGAPEIFAEIVFNDWLMAGEALNERIVFGFTQTSSSSPQNSALLTLFRNESNNVLVSGSSGPAATPILIAETLNMPANLNDPVTFRIGMNFTDQTYSIWYQFGGAADFTLLGTAGIYGERDSLFLRFGADEFFTDAGEIVSISSISVYAVPEPATWISLAAGLATLIPILRRRPA